MFDVTNTVFSTDSFCYNDGTEYTSVDSYCGESKNSWGFIALS